MIIIIIIIIIILIIMITIMEGNQENMGGLLGTARDLQSP